MGSDQGVAADVMAVIKDARFEVKTAVCKLWLKEDPKYADVMCRPYGEGRVCFCPERVVGMATVHV